LIKRILGVIFKKLQYAPRNMHFGLASGVHLGRYQIGGLNCKNSARCASNSLQFLTPPDPLAFLSKWTMRLNQNTYCARLPADYPVFILIRMDVNWADHGVVWKPV
jgi:hypothetical protein